MNRRLLLSLAWSTLAIGISHAVPARPLYEPPPPPKAPAPKMLFDLRGTAWLGKYGTINRYFQFEIDGTLSYKSSTLVNANFIKNRGRWWVNGTTVFFEHNIGANKVMDFRGTIQDANTIVGESVSRTGARTTQTMKRAAPKIK